MPQHYKGVDLHSYNNFQEAFANETKWPAIVKGCAIDLKRDHCHDTIIPLWRGNENCSFAQLGEPLLWLNAGELVGNSQVEINVCFWQCY